MIFPTGEFGAVLPGVSVCYAILGEVHQSLLLRSSRKDPLAAPVGFNVGLIHVACVRVTNRKVSHARRCHIGGAVRNVQWLESAL